MQKIYEDADDQHVAGFVVYGDMNTHKLYANAKKTEYLNADEFKSAFDKHRLYVRFVVNTLANFYVDMPPVAYAISETGITVGTINGDYAEGAAPFVTWTVAVDPDA